MIGVSAIALDCGFRIIIVLAGTKDDLREQTALRFNTQLLRKRDQIGGTGLWTLPPGPPGLPAFSLPYDVDAHNFRLLHIRIMGALQTGEPVVLVIKKHVASMDAVRARLSYAYTGLGVQQLPTLIIDDECDDASVDSREMPIPAAIANLWRREGEHPHVVYLGYTATAAANLLQEARNELYPDDFVYLLKYPGSIETVLEYPEDTADAWYSGTQCFYEEFGEVPGDDSNFLVSSVVHPSHLVGAVRDNLSLRDAIRAYILSAAFRLALAPDTSPTDPHRLASPHTMLVQTSSALDEHETWLLGIAAMFGGTRSPDGTLPLDPGLVEADLRTNGDRWRYWHGSFADARERIYMQRPRTTPQMQPSWEQVLTAIPLAVGATRVKAINSDPERGHGLSYYPRVSSTGEKLLPHDVFVIAIGGNKLSRGITLEGLCITYFTRWNPAPTEDTVLQLSRWLGYRGPHLEFCRLFTSVEVYDNLRRMHENDRDLRLQLADLMAQRSSPRDAALCFRTVPNALPTAKLGIGKLYELRFSPSTAMIRKVETGDLAHSNVTAALTLIRAIKDRPHEAVRNDSGVQKGILSRGWTASEVADALESFRYSGHNPDPTDNPARGFYRKPDPSLPLGRAFFASDDPYQLAAYLRQWNEGTAGPNATCPNFNVGVAFGEMRSDIDPFDFPLVDREISDKGFIIGTWGGRSQNWPGDALFDRPAADLVVPNTALRRAGAPGLLLLYVIHKKAKGRVGRGCIRDKHSPTLAIAIPGGGPLIRAVTVVQR